MRAVLVLLTGFLIMVASPKERIARALDGGSREDLMGGIQKGTQPHPFFDMNPEFKEWQSLMGQVDTGRLTRDEAQKIHRKKWNYEAEPSPSDPPKGLPGLNRSWDR